MTKKVENLYARLEGKMTKKWKFISAPVPANNEKLILTFVGKNVEKKGRKVEISKSMKR